MSNKKRPSRVQQLEKMLKIATDCLGTISHPLDYEIEASENYKQGLKDGHKYSMDFAKNALVAIKDIQEENKT